jgi:hypothetical protein
MNQNHLIDPRFPVGRIGIQPVLRLGLPLGFLCLVAIAAIVFTAEPVVGQAKKKEAPTVPLTESGEKLLAKYSEMLKISWCPATIERRAPVFYNSCTPLTTPGTDPSELLPWMTSRLSAARTRTVPTTANAATAISPCVHTTGRSSAACCIARHARPVFPSAKVPRCSTPACPRTKSSRSSLTSPRAVACGRPAAWSA